MLKKDSNNEDTDRQIGGIGRRCSLGAALAPAQTLVGWGDNFSGQTNVFAEAYTAIAARTHHSLGLRTDGTVVGWGFNGNGQTNVSPEPIPRSRRAHTTVWH